MNEVALHPGNPDDEVDVEKEREEQARELVNRGVQLAKKMQAIDRAKETVDNKKITAGGLNTGYTTTTVVCDPVDMEDGSKVRLSSVVTVDHGHDDIAQTRISVAKTDMKLGDPRADYFVDDWLEARSNADEASASGINLEEGRAGLGVPDIQEADASGELDRILDLIEQQPAQ